MWQSWLERTLGARSGEKGEKYKLRRARSDQVSGNGAADNGRHPREPAAEPVGDPSSVESPGWRQVELADPAARTVAGP